MTAITAGDEHTCALVNGGVQCWGANDSGQLGNNSTTNSSVPVQVTGLTSGVTAITAGGAHTCAIVNGGVQCWGDNTYGQLGNESETICNSSGFTCGLVPMPVIGLASDSGVTAIAAGQHHVCAVVNGGVQCWGDNTYGELGNDSTAICNNSGFACSFVPMPVIGLTSGGGVTAVAAAPGFACAVVNGGVQCWGVNANGELGYNSTSTCNDSDYPCSSVPAQVTGLASGSGVTTIAVGGGFACAVVNGGVQCWGANDSGQLGNNSTTSSSVPVQVSGLASVNGVTAAAVGGFACAVLNGGVQCWGDNTYGELGNDSTTATCFGGARCGRVPVPVAGLESGSGVTAITAGDFFVCAVVSGGVQCWGANDLGQLGNNSATNSSVPVHVVAGL